MKIKALLATSAALSVIALSGCGSRAYVENDRLGNNIYRTTRVTAAPRNTVAPRSTTVPRNTGYGYGTDTSDNAYDINRTNLNRTAGYNRALTNDINRTGNTFTARNNARINTTRRTGNTANSNYRRGVTTNNNLNTTGLTNNIVRQADRFTTGNRTTGNAVTNRTVNDITNNNQAVNRHYNANNAYDYNYDYGYDYGVNSGTAGGMNAYTGRINRNTANNRPAGVTPLADYNTSEYYAPGRYNTMTRTNNNTGMYNTNFYDTNNVTGTLENTTTGTTGITPRTNTGTAARAGATQRPATANTASPRTR